MKALLSVRTLALLAVAIGVVVGGLAGGSGRAGLEAADVEARALVKRLGSDRFSNRDTAQKRLRELGVKALPALKAGMADPTLEVAKRIALVRSAITQDRLWAAFAPIAGDGAAARDLFAEMMSR